MVLSYRTHARGALGCGVEENLEDITSLSPKEKPKSMGKKMQHLPKSPEALQTLLLIMTDILSDSRVRWCHTARLSLQGHLCL